MIAGHHWAVWLCWMLAAFYLYNGIVNLRGPQPMRDALTRWGFPPWFHIANGLLQIAIAALLVLDDTRLAGLGLSVLLCLAIFATLIRNDELHHLRPGIVLFIATLVAGIGVLTA